MPKKNGNVAKAKPPVSASGTNHHADAKQIAARAYELFQKRGAANGHALDDWLQAERELAAIKKPAAPVRASKSR
jgi:Protein of unknown function (DUF2934)